MACRTSRRPLGAFCVLLGVAASASAPCSWDTLKRTTPKDAQLPWTPTDALSLTLALPAATASQGRFSGTNWALVSHRVARAAGIDPAAVAVVGNTPRKAAGGGGGGGGSQAEVMLRIGAPCSGIARALLARISGGASGAQFLAKLRRGGGGGGLGTLLRGATLVPGTATMGPADASPACGAGQLREGGVETGALLRFPAVVASSAQRVWAGQRASNVLLPDRACRWRAPMLAPPPPQESGVGSPVPPRQWVVFDFARPVAVADVRVTLPGDASNPRHLVWQAATTTKQHRGGALHALGSGSGGIGSRGPASQAAILSHLAFKTVLTVSVPSASATSAFASVCAGARAGAWAQQDVTRCHLSAALRSDDGHDDGRLAALPAARYWRLLLPDSFGGPGGAGGVEVARAEFRCVGGDGFVSEGACLTEDWTEAGLFAALSANSLGAAVAGASACALLCICGWLRALRRELSNNKLEIEREMAVRSRCSATRCSALLCSALLCSACRARMPPPLPRARARVRPRPACAECRLTAACPLPPTTGNASDSERLRHRRRGWRISGTWWVSIQRAGI